MFYLWFQSCINDHVKHCQLEPDEGPTTVHASLCKADFLIFFHMATDNDNHTQVTDHPSFYKQRIGYFLPWLISKQLNAADLGGVHGNYPLLQKEAVPAIGRILCVH